MRVEITETGRIAHLQQECAIWPRCRIPPANRRIGQIAGMRQLSDA